MNKKVVIIGAGITGLVLAYYFSKSNNFDVTLIEKKEQVGGTALSFEHKDFILDYGPHKIYSEIPGIIDEIKKITSLLKIKKKNSIYLKNNFFDFPLKMSQVGIKIPFTAINSGLDILNKPFNKFPDDSYENFLINRFGKTLYSLSFKDYAEKVWGTKPLELDKELAIRRVAISNIFELIKGVLLNKNISAEYFAYPPCGIKQMLDLLVEKIRDNQGTILTKSEISKIIIKNKSIDSIKIGGKTLKPDYVISTICLDDLIEIIEDKNKKKEVINSSKNLKYQKVNVLYFILNKKRALKDCWIFFPEKKFMFHRISEQKAFSKYTSPENKTCLMVETTKPINKENIKKIIYQLEKIKILDKSDIGEYFVKSLEKVYPVYKKGFLEDLNKVVNYLESIKNFYTLGRQGLFNYNNMDQCWDMGKKTFEHIEKNGSKEDWEGTKKYFNNYRIVD